MIQRWAATLICIIHDFILEDATKILLLQNTEISFVVVGDEVDYDVLCPNITLKIYSNVFGFEGEKLIRVLNHRRLQITAWAGEKLLDYERGPHVQWRVS